MCRRRRAASLFYAPQHGPEQRIWLAWAWAFDCAGAAHMRVVSCREGLQRLLISFICPPWKGGAGSRPSRLTGAAGGGLSSQIDDAQRANEISSTAK